MYASPTEPIQIYRPSGKVPFMGLLWLGLTGVVAIPLLGFLYGLLLTYIPFIFLNLLIVAGYVVAITYLIGQAIKFGKIRNPFLWGVAGIGLGLLAEYMGWIGWLCAQAGSLKYVVLFLFPGRVLEIAQAIAQEGVWSIRGLTPTGMALYLIWLVEAGAVVGGIAYLTLQTHLEIPFCEDCNDWAAQKRILGILKLPESLAEFKHALRERGLPALNELQPAPPGASEFLFMELHSCPKCQSFYVLHVKKMKLGRDSKGRQTTSDSTVAANLLVNAGYVSTLYRLAGMEAPAKIA